MNKLLSIEEAPNRICTSVQKPMSMPTENEWEWLAASVRSQLFLMDLTQTFFGQSVFLGKRVVFPPF